MSLPRRRFLHLVSGAVLLPAVSRIARAQAYPTSPVRIIVGAAAGGTNDILARLIGQWLSDKLGQPYLVEDRPGAGGNIATEAVVRARADGYTLHLSGTPDTVNATLYDKLNFSFVRDIAPVASIMRTPLVVVVNPSIPVKTLTELIAYAKADPRRLDMGSAGIGTPPHIAGELFKMRAGVDMQHVPYRGGAPAVSDFDRRTAADHVRRDARLHRTCQGRQATRPRGHDRDALGGVAGHPNRGGCFAGLRVEPLDRHRCAQEHARRHHREAEQGD
jgi:tripartite-type tricarboxylate transporter receptor subunit TctC